MAKVVTFFVFVIGVVSVLSLGKYTKLPVNNKRFDIEAHKPSAPAHGKTQSHDSH